MLSPTNKGGLAELAIQWAAVRAGYVVSRPVVEGGRYDLVFDDGRGLHRVQCKWASFRGDVVRIRTRTCRRSATGYVRGTYSDEEIDAVAGFCAGLDRCYLIPIAEVDGRQLIDLRLRPTRNNQAVGVKWASRYELGAIAQLGERVHGMHEVVGSSPTSSTP